MSEDRAQEISQDQERKIVKTTVPAYQKEEWVDHADELDMTQTEYIRCMVQVGRRDLLEFNEAAAEAAEDQRACDQCGNTDVDSEYCPECGSAMSPGDGAGESNPTDPESQSLELTLNLNGDGVVGVDGEANQQP